MHAHGYISQCVFYWFRIQNTVPSCQKYTTIDCFSTIFPTGIVIMILWNIVKIIYFKGQIDVAFKIGNENRIFGGPVPHLDYPDRP